jgi:hypothetical protein
MSSSEQGKRTKKAPPSFDGRGDFEVDVSPMDGGGDETTRRAGGGISFAPMISPLSSGVQAYGSQSLYAEPASQQTQTSKPQAVSSAPTVSSSAPAPFAWTLREVPTLPELHPLERTAVFVEGSSPTEISQAISKVLMERSIEAEYENEKAKAKCLTPEGVECRVRLYRGRGKYSHGIIVEVQRRFGASVNFHEHVTAILDAAQGKTPAPAPPATLSRDTLPLVSDAEDDYAAPSGADSLLMVEKMFGHGGYDSQYLALQTLASLTDSKKMGKSTALAVSTELLSSSNEVGSKVFDILSKKESEEEVFKLRVVALSILANALEAVQGKMEGVLREMLRPILLRQLSKAASNPRAAQMAARSFEFLYQGDHDQGEVAAALEAARAVGAARHAGLFQQAQLCLDKML